MTKVTMKDLLKSGVHFGHQTKRWNPKMKPYIFGEKKGIHIIDLQKSLPLINDALEKITQIAEAGGTVLFVGTKKQAQDSIREEAKRCGMPYVSYRWLGGMLTNFKVIKQRKEYLKELERMEEEGEFEEIPSKEASRLRKEKDKLEQTFSGILEMDKLPDALFITDIKKEKNAVAEANKLGIPVFAIVDTNCDPDKIDYLIPGNDDAIRATRVICRAFADAILEGRQQELEGREVNEEEKLAEETQKESEEEISEEDVEELEEEME
jgi:small subunit ribosomal protein S2